MKFNPQDIEAGLQHLKQNRNHQPLDESVVDTHSAAIDATLGAERVNNPVRGNGGRGGR